MKTNVSNLNCIHYFNMFQPHPLLTLHMSCSHKVVERVVRLFTFFTSHVSCASFRIYYIDAKQEPNDSPYSGHQAVLILNTVT